MKSKNIIGVILGIIIFVGLGLAGEALWVYLLYDVTENIYFALPQLIRESVFAVGWIFILGFVVWVSSVVVNNMCSHKAKMAYFIIVCVLLVVRTIQITIATFVSMGKFIDVVDLLVPTCVYVFIGFFVYQITLKKDF